MCNALQRRFEQVKSISTAVCINDGRVIPVMMMMIQVWMFVSGAEQRRRERPDLYRKLLDSPQDSQLVELIKIGLS